MCLIYKLTLLQVCIYIGKNLAHIGFGTICSFRHPLGSWNVSPSVKGGVLQFSCCGVSLENLKLELPRGRGVECCVWLASPTLPSCILRKPLRALYSSRPQPFRHQGLGSLKTIFSTDGGGLGGEDGSGGTGLRPMGQGPLLYRAQHPPLTWALRGTQGHMAPSTVFGMRKGLSKFLVNEPVT